MRYIIDHDYHIHSQLSLCSGDEEQTPRRILQYAEEEGLKSICITDHFWDSAVSGSSEWYGVQNYEHIAQALPLPQSENVRFHFGCETEMDIHMNIAISKPVMDKMDFVIIPTTHMRSIGLTIDEKDDNFERRRELYIERFEHLLNMDLPFWKIGIAHPLCAGATNTWEEHILLFDSIEDSVYRKLFTKAAKLGAGVELNMESFRYTEEETSKIFRPYFIAKECGCKFYLGSDTHFAADFAKAMPNFKHMTDILDLHEDEKFTFEK